MEDPKRPWCLQRIPSMGVMSRKLPCALQRGAKVLCASPALLLRPGNSSTGRALHMGNAGLFRTWPC